MYKYKKNKGTFSEDQDYGNEKNTYPQQRAAAMTAKGQHELEVSGAKFRRNFIALLTSDWCRERIRFHADGDETGGGGVLDEQSVVS